MNGTQKNNFWWLVALVGLSLLPACVGLMKWRGGGLEEMQDVTGWLMWWYQWLLHFALCLMFVMVIQKEWSWRLLTITGVVAMLVATFEVIDGPLHEMLLDFGVYPSAWYTQQGPRGVNIHYAKFVVFLTGLTLLFASCVKSRSRSWGKIMTLGVALVVFALFVLLHRVIITHMYNGVKDIEGQRIYRVMDTDLNTMQTICQHSTWSCWAGVGFPTQIGDNRLTPRMATALKEQLMLRDCTKEPCIISSQKFDSNPNIGKHLPKPIGVFYRDGLWRFVMDAKNSTERFLRFDLGLGILGVTSANVWLLGAFALWGFHRRRFEKRRNNEIGRRNSN